MSDPKKSGPDLDQLERTQLLCNELTVKGDRFAWWAVGKNPTHVTVSHPILGKKSDFTLDDPEQLAVTLANALLKRY